MSRGFVRRPRGRVLSAAAIVACIAAVTALTGCEGPPTVSGTVSPSSISIENGTVRLNATVANASSCLFSVTPATLGFPTTIPCTSGLVTHASVLPPNATATAMTYAFSVKVTGPGGSVSASLGTVSVASGAGGGDIVSNAGASNCTLLASGGVDCWGVEVGGQLGNNTSSNANMTHTRVLGVGGSGVLTGVQSLATNDANSYCAVLHATGGVVCWGSNYRYQLGNGTTASNDLTPTAVMLNAQTALSGVQTVVGMDGASYTYCALLIAGGVDCWGDGLTGELGTGQNTTSKFAQPVHPVSGTGSLSGVHSLVATAGSFCALLNGSGGVDCWGHGGDGELGSGTGYVDSAVPVQVQGVGGAGTSVRQILNGGSRYCAVLSSDSSVVCWGYAVIGGTTDSDVPVSVVTDSVGTKLTGATNVGSYVVGMCAALGTHGIDCWGDHTYGEIGNGTTGPGATKYAMPVTGPISASFLTGADAANVEANTCALLTSGGVDCWGYNAFGELGDGNTAELDNPFPQTVHGVGTTTALSNVVTLEGKLATFCAVVTSGNVDCWGNNHDDQLDNGAAPTNSAIPVRADTIT